MGNRMKGEASFEHEGRAVNLTVNMDMLLRAEDETGEGLLALLSTARIGFLAVLLRHAMIEAGEAALARADAAELLMAGSAREALRDALNAAFPPEEPGAAGSMEGNAPPAKRRDGTGTKS